MENTPRIQIIVADITTLKVDAIVNAAKNSLMGGGGVDGAIHRAAGPNLLKDCKTIEGGCPTGEARITLGYDLPAKYVIHTVGPVYRAVTVVETWGPECASNCDNSESANLLTSCYEECLELAAACNLKSIAFPAISTGIYGYPLRDATEIAMSVAMNAIDNHDYNGTIIFCCFDEKTAQVYREAYSDFIE